MSPILSCTSAPGRRSVRSERVSDSYNHPNGVAPAIYCHGLFLLRPTTGLSRFPARLDLPDRPRSPAISLDDLLAVPRPLQQGLQSRATAHANARGLLEGLRRSPHSLRDVRALTVEAATWNRDVFLRIPRSYRDCSRLTGKPEGIHSSVDWSRQPARGSEKQDSGRVLATRPLPGYRKCRCRIR